MARAKKPRLEESIDSDDLSSDHGPEGVEEAPVLSAEEKRLLMAQEYMEKIGIKYEGDELETVASALGVDREKETRTRPLASELVLGASTIWACRKHMPTCVEISYDDRTVFTGGKDGRIARWDVESGRRLGFLGHNRDGQKGDSHKSDGHKSDGHKGAVLAMTLAMGGKLLATAGKDCVIKLWDLASGALIKDMTGHTEPVTGLCSAGDMVYSVSADKTMREWSLVHKTCMKTNYGHTESATCIDCLNKTFVLSGSEDRTSRYWNTLKSKHAIYEEPDNVDTCAFLSKHGFLTGSSDGTVCLWSIARKKAVLRKSLSHVANKGGPKPWCTAVAVCPNSDVAFTGSNTGSISVWKVAMAEKGGILEPILDPLPAPGVVNALRVSRSGAYLVGVSAAEPRLGRWFHSPKDATVGVIMVKLQHSYISKLFDNVDSVL
ncbi:putative U3 small nucleolar RNA-interacting protein 2 [Gregarina niphandrodes]|uniref:U3 small nucleolar RNA-interacting protein 2 n=1 Tax=Gregarina niphandrodes TaxID=110365 RepID=A0A023BCE2_GRENI|nr:putative U3 small nucleolar RNA-interacting protein 2 [Gregarina niphandrodes]EZG83896.1 putative U3 small nucleolar RNA-interacting protein 2 [Gregarina niphandrodes]|eukprot:XP_011128895.1 putative U3 small nucleolar RNA-interacting protein 2 [Gregarina niphandrodes]